MSLLNYAGLTIACIFCLFLTKAWIGFAYQVEWLAVLNRLAFGDVAWVPRLFAVLGYLLCVVLMSMQLSTVIDRPLQKYYGSTTQMVYGGNNGSHDIWYKAPGDEPSKQMAAISDMSDRYSFNSIFQQHSFRGIAPKPGNYGFRIVQPTVVTRPPLYWLSKIVFILFCIGITIGCVHIFAWEAQGLTPTITDRFSAPGLAFEQILSGLKLNKAVYGTSLFLAPLLIIALHLASTSRGAIEISKKNTQIRVDPGQELLGKVITLEIVKIRRERLKTNHKEQTEHYYVDEGDREAFVEFSNIYPAPIHVGFKYNAFEKPELNRELKEAEKSEHTKRFTVSKGLTISPIE